MVEWVGKTYRFAKAYVSWSERSVIRIQLHLAAEQDRQLRKLAKARRVTRAELIRRGIDLVLAEGQAGDPLLSMIGAAPKGPATDLSEHHDHALYGLQSEPLPLPEVADRKQK